MPRPRWISRGRRSYSSAYRTSGNAAQPAYYMVFRPCDTRETAAGWYAALTHTTTPTGLILSRQNMPALEGTGKGALKGAYILRDCEGTPDVLLMASGSEVELIYKAYDELAAKGVKAKS